MENKTKILIPPTLVIPKYGKLVPVKKIEDRQEQLKMFTNPNATYIFNANPNNKEMNEINIQPGILNYLNICGDLIINVPKVSHFLLNFYANTHSTIEKYGHSDYLKSKKLTINSPQSVKVCIHNSYEKNNSLPLEELEINTYFIELDLESLPNLKKIKIAFPERELDKIKGWHTRSEINLKSLYNLKEIDLSTIDFFNRNNLKLENIPLDCKLIFSINAAFDYRVNQPNRCCDLKNICQNMYYYSDSEQGRLYLKELFPEFDSKQKIEITVKQLRDKFIDFSNKIVSQKMQESIKQEQEEIKKVNEYWDKKKTETKNLKTSDIEKIK